LLPVLGKIDLAMVGEPTGMEMAVAEKGLIVLRCRAKGRSGHAARDNGENAISNAMQDIQWLHSYQFPNVSEMLGQVKMTVTMISAGTQHNVIPDHCEYTIDIRTTDTANNALVLKTIQAHIAAEITGPNLNLNASTIAPDHPLVLKAKSLGIPCFGSPTLSDQSLLDAPSVKMGPGRSERSHTANEYVHISEIRQGIEGYIDLLEQFLKI
ncbi:MAG: acetylornithine deacetylase, partial [Calditrichales bacterium]